MKNKERWEKKSPDIKDQNIEQLLKDTKILKVKKEIELEKKNFEKILPTTGQRKFKIRDVGLSGLRKKCQFLFGSSP